MYNERAPGMQKGMFGSKDFLPARVRVLTEFHETSFWFPHILNLSETIIQVTDVSDLWLREFYLEMTRRLQFPIEMSLPWILADHVIASKDLSLMESIFFPFEIYNDAASRALSTLNQQFLYDEIEGEVNLCFDQLVYKLSDQIYRHYKEHAARYARYLDMHLLVTVF